MSGRGHSSCKKTDKEQKASSADAFQNFPEAHEEHHCWADRLDDLLCTAILGCSARLSHLHRKHAQRRDLLQSIVSAREASRHTLQVPVAARAAPEPSKSLYHPQHHLQSPEPIESSRVRQQRLDMRKRTNLSEGAGCKSPGRSNRNLGPFCFAGASLEPPGYCCAVMRLCQAFDIGLLHLQMRPKKDLHNQGS